MQITESTTVADVASAIPSSVRVFQRYGIDFCCGGKSALAAACQAQGVPYAELVDAIDASAQQPRADARDWNREPLHALVDHIVTTYHEPLREEPAYYDKRCLECHTLKSKPAKAGDGSSCPVAEKNCTSCHMPKIEIKAAHFKFTDHNIRIVRPGEKYPN